MSKRKKLPQIGTVISNGWKMRPVEASDKWCERKGLYNGRIPEGKDPWGYILTIPYIPNQNMYLEEYDGYFVVRTKKRGKNMLLQIVPGKGNVVPRYGVKSFTRADRIAKRKGHKISKTKYGRIVHMRRFSRENDKSMDKW